VNPLYILIALQLLDLLTTVVALRNQRLTEGNSVGLIQKMMDKIGVQPALVVIKLAFAAIIFWALPLIPAELAAVPWLVAAGYCWVVYNNIKLIRSH